MVKLTVFNVEPLKYLTRLTLAVVLGLNQITCSKSAYGIQMRVV